MPMPLIPDIAVFQRKLATLPLATYQAGETVLSAASTTGRLLILKEGAVAVVKEGLEIARVTEPGAVFGELSVLLDQPHTADVRALEASQFHVADAATILRVDPIALLYVATVLLSALAIELMLMTLPPFGPMTASLVARIVPSTLMLNSRWNSSSVM